MFILPEISMQEYLYDLPDERVAKYPLSERDASRLLEWRQGSIRHLQFLELPGLLDAHSILYFNNTKVIPARLYFRKPTGGLIEVFLLNPESPAVIDQAMQAGPGVEWRCAIGNLKRWNKGLVLERTLEYGALRVHLVDRQQQIVRFEWDNPALPFVKMVEAAGQAPIPPYLNRAAEESDKGRYQTVYSKQEGAVAAPTAGLHFTPNVLARLSSAGILQEELTLHVSAGTFRPVKAANAIEHDMHSEQVVVRRSNIEGLLKGRKVVAVGTTSMRTLESLYWYGARLCLNPEAVFQIDKLEPYGRDESALPSLRDAASALLQRMERDGVEEIHGSTSIYIFPGYRFRVVEGLVTNFHQPGSTLLLLVAAFTGNDQWKKIYEAALQNDYRFLSYGDSSLLWRS
ncbi:MAG: S-adenosylmethionine:tRNA ribosyltransferase-isomerase [Lewinellaceae bacterium]|nr:S-adenosylmethionine:tRNA ribosyltransferase-isomerase [Lewinellaceae bacterium]